MPCSDGDVPYPKSREEELNEKVPAPILCALLSNNIVTIEQMGRPEVLHDAGIRYQELIEWWEHHQARDRERKRWEEQRQRELDVKARQELERLIAKYPETAAELVKARKP